MKKFKYSLLVVMAIAAQSAIAKDKLIECSSKGKSLSQSGGLLEARATLTFFDSKVNGVRTLKEVEGQIVIFGESNVIDDSSYVGNYKINSISEDLNYKPRRYKNYSRFKDFEAFDTKDSSEHGMWGNFLLEKNTSKKKFSAEYIFQAGDHMGGTLHMTCNLL